MVKEILLSFVAGAIICSCATYDYVSTKANLEITNSKLANEKALKEQSEQLIKQERINASTTSSLNQKVAEGQATIASLSNDLAKYRDASNRLRIKPTICEPIKDTGTSSGTSNTSQESSYRFSAEFERFLVTREKEFEELKLYANVCHEYAGDIIAQRERMSNGSSN